MLFSPGRIEKNQQTGAHSQNTVGIGVAITSPSPGYGTYLVPPSPVSFHGMNPRGCMIFRNKNAQE